MYSVEREFLGHCVKELLAKGVHVELSPEDTVVYDGAPCSGWYDDGKASKNSTRRELVVATGRPDWIHVFAHEYCHFTQDEDGMFDDLTEDVFWDWLSGKVELEPEETDKHVIASRELEADCERRTIALLEEFSIPFDRAEYAKKANAYILFYNTIRRDRKWASKAKPYDCLEILARMEDEILDDFTDGPQWDWFHDLVREHCYDD